jgi:hypothetical protein
MQFKLREGLEREPSFFISAGEFRFYANTALNATSIALTVFSISFLVCANDMNAASNCEGGRYIPCPSIEPK